ncbi:MAG: D-alanine--D-alanine ligase [Clostridiales bacterium]|nr:D-alanine--D-alanine ligase [Clostridiales bacterium]
MKIVVLAGGLSDERNVSLSSGVLVSEALRGRGHQVALVDLYLGIEDENQSLEALFQAPLPEHWKKVSRQAPDLAALKVARKWKSDSLFGKGVLELCRLADIVFLALHGACGEDGRIQATLETLGIPFTGTGFLAAAIAMDKDLTKKLVIPTGVQTPAWEKVTYTPADIPAIAQRTALPVVVKPLASGSSIGVAIARTQEELVQALENCVPLGASVVLEQYVAGREIQVAYLVDRALPSIEIIPKTGFYDYENKYQPGAAEEVAPAPIPAEWERRLRSDTEKVFRAVGMAVYARADFIVTEDGTPWFLEINTLPGMTPTSLVPQEAAVVGISYGELCETIVNESLRIRG